uniref:hypothetical protein n=1 Tax=Burkholderia sp. M701 TaxID=326454 RepID=UPI0012EC2ADC|nr:hypothetical protein [Burkholderia sp. M701]
MTEHMKAIIEAAAETAEFRNEIPGHISFEKARLFKTAMLRTEIGEIFPQYKGIAGQCVRVSAEKIQFNPVFKEFEVVFQVYRDMTDASFVSHFSPRALTQFGL